jgi:hypothetical protein
MSTYFLYFILAIYNNKYLLKLVSLLRKKNYQIYVHVYCENIKINFEKLNCFHNFDKKQDIYGFLVKNLDLDSNLYNLKKRIKKAS